MNTNRTKPQAPERIRPEAKPILDEHDHPGAVTPPDHDVADADWHPDVAPASRRRRRGARR